MKNKKDFAHLHVHSQYSLLDGTIKVKELVARVKELGMSSCALTDHGNLHGMIEFYKAAKKQKIKPIIGCEAYITFDADDLDNADKTRDNYHMVLLAMNNKGLRNLVSLTSHANIHNFYYKPRINWDRLLTHNEGLIATTACLGGIIAKSKRLSPAGDLIVPGAEYDEESQVFLDPLNILESRLLSLKKAFSDRFYIEIQEHNFWEQRAFNLWAQRTAWSMDIPLVLTTDAHYLRHRDHKTHALILAQQMKKTLAEYRQSGELEYDDKSFIRTPEDMHEVARYLACPEAVENTLAIAKQCNVEIELGKYQVPAFDITKTDDYQDFLEWKEKDEA